jgi:hypothetical protein
VRFPKKPINSLLFQEKLFALKITPQREDLFFFFSGKGLARPSKPFKAAEKIEF